MNPDRALLATCAAIVATALVANVLLVLGIFSAQLAVVSGIAIGAACYVRGGGVAITQDRGTIAGLFVIALAALVLRLPVVAHVEGGQDQGVYVSMAAHFVDEGTLEVRDRLMERLPDAASRERYDQALRDVFVPGVYRSDEPGQYIFQFYHVHPAMLAVASGLFGRSHAGWWSIIASIGSILFLALAVATVSRRKSAALWCGALLALNPLHLFFAKFPVSESTTLLLLSIWLWLVARIARLDGRVARREFVLAAAVFLAVALTRITTFVLIPGLLAALLLAFDPAVARARRRAVVAVVVPAFLMFAGSVVYGRYFSEPYTTALWGYAFGRSAVAVGWGAVGALALLVFAALQARSEQPMRAIAALGRYASRWMPAAIVAASIAVIATTAVRLYLLGFTDQHVGQANDLLFPVAGSGWSAAGHLSIVVAMLYTGPVVVALAFYGLFSRLGGTAALVGAALLLGVALHVALVQWHVPYQYYYARYLLSELVPLTIAAGVCVAACLPGRSATVAVFGLAATVLYFAVMGSPLYGRREGDGMERSLASLADRIGPSGVLILDAEIGLNEWIYRTPLHFHFRRDVYPVRSWQQLEWALADLKSAKYADILLLTNASSAPSGFKQLRDMVYRADITEHSSGTPSQLLELTRRHRLFLYDAALDHRNWPSQNVPLVRYRPSRLQGFHADQLWTTAEARILGIDVPARARKLVIVRAGYRPDLDGVKLEVALDRTPLQILETTPEAITLEVPGPLRGTSGTLSISVDTFRPSDGGHSNDPRDLGLDIHSLRFER